MPIIITALLILSAFVCTIASALGKCPLWVPTLLVVVALALQTFGR